MAPPYLVGLSFLLLGVEIYLHSAPSLPRPAPLRASNSSGAGLLAATRPPPRDLPAVGTPFAPCTDTSAYMKGRLAHLWKRFKDSNAGDNHAAGCVRCLGAEGNVGQEVSCESQFGQELFLYNNFFRCLEGPGSYIDAGAHLPQHLSTSWALDICLGWTSGICVEANNGYAAQFRDALRTCTVVGSALAEFDGVLSLGAAGASSSVKFDADAGETVKATTLANVLRDAKWVEPGSSEMVIVDFLTVDVEGAELGVLMGIPWDSVWIRFILAENVRGTQDVAEFLYDHGYVKVYTIAVDDLFYKASAMPLQRTEKLEYHRRTTAVTRKNIGVPTYDTPVLYERDWEHVSPLLLLAQRAPQHPPSCNLSPPLPCANRCASCRRRRGRFPRTNSIETVSSVSLA